MNKKNKIGNALVKELSAMMEEMTVSVESCLHDIPGGGAAQPDGENRSNDNPASLSRRVRSRFTSLVDELQESLYPETEGQMTDSDISWLSGILRESGEPAKRSMPINNNGEIEGNAQSETTLQANTLTDEEIYGRKKRKSFLDDEPLREQEIIQEPTPQLTQSTEPSLPSPEPVKPKTPVKQKINRKSERKTERKPEKKIERKKSSFRWMARSVTAGVSVGVLLILGLVGTNVYFQRHFICSLEDSLHGKVRYGQLDTSLTRSTVMLKDTEFLLNAGHETGVPGAVSQPMGVQVEKALFRLAPGSLVQGKVKIQDALMEGMTFPQPPGSRAKVSSGAWMLSPLLSQSCETEIEKQLEKLASVTHFRQMKERYVPRYVELAERSHKINAELRTIHQDLKSRLGLNQLAEMFPSIQDSEHKLASVENLICDNAVRPASYIPTIPGANMAPSVSTAPAANTTNATSATAFADDAGNPLNGNQWIQQDGNAEFLVQTITRLIHLRSESDKIQAGSEAIRQEIGQDMECIKEKVADDGKNFRPYLEPPTLDESMLANAIFADDISEKVQEVALWLETLQQIVAAEFHHEHFVQTADNADSSELAQRFGNAAVSGKKEIPASLQIQRAVTRGEIMLLEQKYKFSGDWKTESAQDGTLQKLTGELVLTPVEGENSATSQDATSQADIRLIVEKENGHPVKHIIANFPACHVSEKLWADNSLPIRANAEHMTVCMDLKYRGEKLSGNMELAYRNLSLESVSHPDVKAHQTLAWENKIPGQKLENLEVSAKISGTRQAPKAECKSPQVAPLLAVYDQTLNELHNTMRSQVAQQFHQKLIDMEDSFHGAVEPAYRQIAARSQNIQTMQETLQGFLVQNMKHDPVSIPYQAAPEQVYPRYQAPSYLVKDGKTYYTTPPQLNDQAYDHAYEHAYVSHHAPPAEDFLLDTPVFNPEWSEIAPAVGGNADAMLAPTPLPETAPVSSRISENAVQLPVRRMSAKERDGIIIIGDSPSAMADSFPPVPVEASPAVPEVAQKPRRQEVDREAMMRVLLSAKPTSQPVPINAQAGANNVNMPLPIVPTAQKTGVPVPMASSSGTYGK